MGTTSCHFIYEFEITLIALSWPRGTRVPLTMRHGMRLVVRAVIATIFLSSPLMAADQQSTDELRLTVGKILLGSAQTKTLGDVREQVVNLFHSLDIDGDPGLTQADYDMAQQINVARMRASTISQILAFDLDGDGQVTREEVRSVLRGQSRQPLSSGGVRVRPTDEQARHVLDRLVEAQMVADTDRDGIISPEEMRSFAVTAQRRSAEVHRQIPLGIASESGKVTLADLNTVLDVIFSEIDSDGNGLLTPTKIAEYQTKMRDIEKVAQERRQREARVAQLKQDAARCGLPPPPKDAVIAVVGAYEGAALSNVTIGDDEEETRVAQVDIQDGDRPLYVVLTSYHHMIWQFSGATSRIAHVVALSGPSRGSARSGVVGIDKSKVVSKSADGCIGYFSDERGAAQQREVIEAYFGRGPDVVAARYQLSRVRLPVGITSGDHPYPKTVPMPEGEAARSVYEEAKRFFPLGVADIDPATVVSASPARHYKTLPSNIGLAYLVDKGVLEVRGYSNAMQIGNTVVIGKMQVESVDPRRIRHFTVPSGYRIVGPMTFPAGLTGAHSVAFVVAKGVQMPSGNPGHSSVVCEVTGAPMKTNAVCN
jgi:Ca2+-binding EF-hand superfamily protein